MLPTNGHKKPAIELLPISHHIDYLIIPHTPVQLPNVYIVHDGLPIKDVLWLPNSFQVIVYGCHYQEPALGI